MVDAHTTTPLRRRLLAVIAIGVVGTGAELALLGHYEELLQWLPLALLGLGAVGLAAVWLRTNRTTLIATFMLGVVYVLAGGLGVLLHYRGNVEFEREMYPSRAGLELVWESLTGATPALAPGAMALLGLLMLAFAFRHPAGAGESLTETEDPT